MDRRKFITRSLTAGAGLAFVNPAFGSFTSAQSATQSLEISLAQWSLHRKLFAGDMDHLDFARMSQGFGCVGLEYVNAFFKDKATDVSYLKEMNSRAEDHQQKNILIMIDGEGGLAEKNVKKRLVNIENHYKWVEAAQVLGCHSIRVNLSGGEDRLDAQKAGIDSLNRLAEFAKSYDVSVLVENHGGFSSDGNWLSNVMQNVSRENIGTLPDFGNFCIERKEQECISAYDRYQGMSELMPFAKALSAKSHAFDEQGNETQSDFFRMIEIAKKNQYSGYVGIEFEGTMDSEEEGIIKTKNLLDKAIAASY
ncbi:sugar phosphate isomerase/epimerase [Flavobacteriaceae bacterium]|nr:sugar phosphate isomerase/epimerase [Flavobacteriaceae bacterium]